MNRGKIRFVKGMVVINHRQFLCIISVLTQKNSQLTTSHLRLKCTKTFLPTFMCWALLSAWWMGLALNKIYNTNSQTYVIGFVGLTLILKLCSKSSTFFTMFLTVSLIIYSYTYAILIHSLNMRKQYFRLKTWNVILNYQIRWDMVSTI